MNLNNIDLGSIKKLDSWNKIISEKDIVVFKRDTTYDVEDIDRDEKYITIIRQQNDYNFIVRTVVDNKNFDQLRGWASKNDEKEGFYLRLKNNEKKKASKSKVKS